MEQQDIRAYNGQQYSVEEGAALIEELDARTKHDVSGYNSIEELGIKLKTLLEGEGFNTLAGLLDTNIEALVDGGILRYDAGSGKWVVSELAQIVIDNAMSDVSTNPVQNNVVKAYIDGLLGGGGGSNYFSMHLGYNGRYNLTNDNQWRFSHLLNDPYPLFDPSVTRTITNGVLSSGELTHFIVPFNCKLVRAYVNFKTQTATNIVSFHLNNYVIGNNSNPTLVFNSKTILETTTNAVSAYRYAKHIVEAPHADIPDETINKDTCLSLGIKCNDSGNAIMDGLVIDLLFEKV